MACTYTVRPLFDTESSTWTYLVIDTATNKAALIDAVAEQFARDLKLIEETGVQLEYLMETHVHADHITAAAAIKDKTGAKIVYGENNKITGADVFLKDGETLALGDTAIKALSTPGHTGGCLSYLIGGAVFTGDALFIRGCGRTDFQDGSAEKLYDSVHGRLFTLPDDTVVYPGHDYKGMLRSTIGEEKKFNPRLKTSNSKEQFVQIMNGLNLPHPKKIDIAVPANMNAGKAA